MNLVPAIKETEKQIGVIKREYATKINELNEGLNILRKMNTVCERCKGMKEIMRPRACAEDDRDRELIPCPQCMGTGRARKGGQNGE